MSYFKEVNNKAKSELTEYINDRLNDLKIDISNTDLYELHHELFNTDYYVIGYYDAKQKLTEWDIDPLDALNMIQEYEIEQFGEITKRDINHETVLNMVVYILGEELLQSMV